MGEDLVFVVVNELFVKECFAELTVLIKGYCEMSKVYVLAGEGVFDSFYAFYVEFFGVGLI